jgi:site-specific recombinase XerD
MTHPRQERSLLRTHLSRLDETPLDRIGVNDIEDLIARMRRARHRAQDHRSAIVLLHQVFKFAQRKEWCRDNPCARVELPKLDESAEIHFLDQPELEALLRGIDVDSEPFGAPDRTLLLVAAMTGLRQGELLALRWRDVDWPARKIRVRHNYVRGNWGTPKSRRASRSVPMADRVGAELERHYQRSAFQSDDALGGAGRRVGLVIASAARAASRSSCSRPDRQASPRASR